MSNIILTTTEELEAIIHKCILKALRDRAVAATPVTKELFNLAEACDYLHLAEQTMYGYTSNRTIPFIKMRKILYFRKTDLDLWLSQGAKPTKDEISNLGFSLKNTKDK
jgi:excisionase family DNA binding protein